MRMRPGHVLAGGAIVGTLDLAFAILFWHGRVPAARICQSIARGVLGKDAVKGGTNTVVLGVALHFLIATLMTLAYHVVARRVPALVRHPWPLGALYGALLYGVMNFVVLPLSAAGKPSFADHSWVAWSVAMHVVFGIVIAHTARLAAR